MKPTREPSDEALEFAQEVMALPPAARANVIRAIHSISMAHKNLPPEKYERWMRRFCAKRGIVYPRQ
ncbi:MAG: hypothetical protein M5U09_21155 [Gammaproteobacteria bacterium]|nr:hypothetical protein [Gammaproteobacteria bacterium]